MFSYKKYFRSNGLDYYGGQNHENSKEYLLWVNTPKEEFAIEIGVINNRTHKATLSEGAKKLPFKNIKRLIDMAEGIL